MRIGSEAAMAGRKTPAASAAVLAADPRKACRRLMDICFLRLCSSFLATLVDLADALVRAPCAFLAPCAFHGAQPSKLELQTIAPRQELASLNWAWTTSARAALPAWQGAGKG